MSFGIVTHERGVETKQCDAALAAENLLVKEGTDADHVAITAANTDQPMGWARNATDAAEDNVSVQRCGKGGDTKSAVAGAVIAKEARLVPSASGRVETLPVSGGTYWVVGIALAAAAAAGDPIEVSDCVPYPVVVS